MYASIIRSKTSGSRLHALTSNRPSCSTKKGVPSLQHPPQPAKKWRRTAACRTAVGDPGACEALACSSARRHPTPRSARKCIVSMNMRFASSSLPSRAMTNRASVNSSMCAAASSATALSSFTSLRAAASAWTFSRSARSRHGSSASGGAALGSSTSGLEGRPCATSSHVSLHDRAFASSAAMPRADAPGQLRGQPGALFPRALFFAIRGSLGKKRRIAGGCD